MLNVFDDVKVQNSVKPQSVTGAVNGAAVDVRGWEEVGWVFDAGAITATGTLDCKIQESADGSTGWADISGATFSQRTNATQNTLQTGKIRTSGPRLGFQRAVATQATAAALGAVQAVLCRHQASTQNPNALAFVI